MTDKQTTDLGSEAYDLLNGIYQSWLYRIWREHFAQRREDYPPEVTAPLTKREASDLLLAFGSTFTDVIASGEVGSTLSEIKGERTVKAVIKAREDSTESKA